LNLVKQPKDIFLDYYRSRLVYVKNIELLASNERSTLQRREEASWLGMNQGWLASLRACVLS
jgi:hypothetical protein